MNFNISNSQDIEKKDIDFFISAIGYETRSCFIAKKLSSNIKKGLYIRLKDYGSDSYRSVQAEYDKLKFENLCDNFNDIKRRILAVIPENEELHIGVDVSSMPRSYSAKVVNSLTERCTPGTILTVLYTPAKFTVPSDGFGPVVYSGPVISEYAGWSTYPDKPPIAIIGLGFEYDRAIGVIDYLDVDISRAILLMPESIDKRFDHAVRKANKLLLDQIDRRQIIHYKLDCPSDTLITITSIAKGLSNSNRVIIVPFGPKIINTLSVLAAELLREDVTVWRVSGEEFESPIDRHSSGELIYLSLEII